MQSPKNYLILLLSLTTIAGGVLGWRQYQELTALRAAALNNEERAGWQKRLWAAEKQRTALQHELDAAKQKPAPTDDAPAPDVAATNRPRSDRGDGRANFMAMMERPEIQRLLALQQKAALDPRYAPLFKNLSLTPEQLDKFKNLLVEKQTSMMDVFAAARAQGINPRTDPDAFKSLVANAQADIDASIKSTLGDVAFSQYQNYEQTLPQRNTVSQLAQRLSYSSTPLSDSQSEQMVAILAATTTAPTGNNRMGPFGGPMMALANGGGSGPSSHITDATLTQAQGVLAAPQLEALQQLQQAQQAQAEMAKAMRQQFQGNQGQGSAPSTPATPKTGTGGG